jgi:hypothetical protein
VSESSPQPLPEAEAEKPEASGLRNLAIAAVLLTTVAVTLPLTLTQAPKVPGGSAPATATALPPAPPHTVTPPAPSVTPEARPAPPPQIVYVPRPVPAPIPAEPAQTAIAAPAPQVLPAQDTVACALISPAVPQLVATGTVLAFESRAISLARIPVAQQQFGGKIDPDYVDNQRVLVRLDTGKMIVYLQPRTLALRIGDRVSVQSDHRNPALPCNYIPNLITADLGPGPSLTPPLPIPPAARP